MDCIVCGSDEYRVKYYGPIRSGLPEKFTDKDCQIIECVECNLVRLRDQLVPDDYYESDKYRLQYNAAVSTEEYIRMHDSQEVERLDYVQALDLRGRVVLDYGCGGGSFLDHIKDMANSTYGIEPYIGYRDDLIARGHQHYANVGEALRHQRLGIDTLTSFCVLEHTESPLGYLQNAYDLIRPGGVMYLETDNINNILMQIGLTEYKKFFYRSAHSYYFSGDTVTRIAKKAGFSNIKLSYRQVYDISNLVFWLKDKIPTGVGKIELFDQRINEEYRCYLETIGAADFIFLRMEKS